MKIDIFIKKKVKIKYYQHVKSTDSRWLEFANIRPGKSVGGC